jgi:hypothetical protein
MAVEDAMLFYDLLLRQQKDRYKHYLAKKIAATISISSDWVCFAAYLLDDEGSGTTTGPDLARHEVKSVLEGGGYEYQYHKNSWEGKLKSDGQVDHVFVRRSVDLLNVTVRFASGEMIRDNFLDIWLRELQKDGGYGEKQRFRRSVPSAWVEQKAKVLLQIVGGKHKP